MLAFQTLVLNNIKEIKSLKYHRRTENLNKGNIQMPDIKFHLFRQF